jgi:hypothetical protein
MLSFFLFFCGTGVWTHGLMLARGVTLPLEPCHQPGDTFVIKFYFLCLITLELYVIFQFCAKIFVIIVKYTIICH